MEIGKRQEKIHGEVQIQVDIVGPALLTVDVAQALRMLEHNGSCKSTTIRRVQELVPRLAAELLPKVGKRPSQWYNSVSRLLWKHLLPSLQLPFPLLHPRTLETTWKFLFKYLFFAALWKITGFVMLHSTNVLFIKLGGRLSVRPRRAIERKRHRIHRFHHLIPQNECEKYQEDTTAVVVGGVIDSLWTNTSLLIHSLRLTQCVSPVLPQPTFFSIFLRVSRVLPSSTHSFE